MFFGQDVFMMPFERFDPPDLVTVEDFKCDPQKRLNAFTGWSSIENRLVDLCCSGTERRVDRMSGLEALLRSYNIVSPFSGTVTPMGESMRHLTTVALQDTPIAQDRDFITFEDELPAEVLMSSTGPLERATYCTDVKQETTDDN
jgi:hypothetical protein